MAEYINPQWRLPNAKEGSNQGYSMNFSGQEINSSSNLGISGASPRTFSAWIKTTDAGGGWDVIVATGGSGNTGNNFELDFRLGKITFNDWGTDTFSGATVNDGNWHNICLTYNGTILKLYIDGIEDTAGDFPATKSVSSTDTPVRIGGMNHNSKYFNGQIYGVAIFDYALPAIGSNSVATLYNSGTPFNPMALASPPKAYYQLGNAAHMGSNYLTPNSAITGGYAMSSTQATSRFFTKIKPAGKSNITFSTWYRAAGSSSGAQIFYSGSYGTYYLKTNGAGVLWHGVMVASGSTGSSAYAIFPFDYDDGNWHHYIFNFDGSHFKTYIDGVLIKKTAKTGVLSSWGSTNAVLGSNHNTNSGASARGDYSNFVAYDSTLTDGGIAEGDVAGGEIAELYNGGSPVLSFDDFPQKSNIETWFRLDQTEIYSGSTWRLNDASSAYSSSLNFDGSSDYIDISGTIYQVGTGDVTISAWANTSTTASGNVDIFGLGDNSVSEIRLQRQANKFGAYVNSSTASGQQLVGATTISTGQWYSVILVKSSNVFTLYLNGVPDNDITWTGGALNATGGSIGAYFGGSSNRFNGSISNAQIFNTALPATGSNSIETLYNSGKPLADMSSFSSLVSWWKLDNTTTGIEDSKGSNDGTNNGTTKVIGSVSTKNSTTWQITPSNLINQTGLLMFKSYSPYALAFDGTKYIDFINSSTMARGQEITYSVWANLNSFGGTLLGNAVSSNFGTALGFDGDVLIFQLGDGFNPSYYNSRITISSYVNTGEWFHIIATFDGTDAKIYINGIERNNWTPTQNPPFTISGWNNFQIGKRSDRAGGFINGRLSNVAFWNSGLTPSQVTTIYNNGIPADISSLNPVAWWQLGSNSSWTSPAWTVLDEIGSNNGTSYSMMENAIVDGVGTSGNGVSTNMSLANNISGSSPNGEGNCLSVNMGVNSRSSDYNN
jgi:hypothetical protein